MPTDGLEQARDLIRYKVSRIVGRHGFNESDREDLEQEILVAVLEGLAKFDPRRSGQRTFVSRLVEWKIAAIIRYRRAARRDYRRVASLPPGLAIADDPTARHDLAHDVQKAIRQLDPELQTLCGLLADRGVVGAAKALGLSRKTVARRVKRIRRHWEETGMSEYLHRPRSTRSAANSGAEVKCTLRKENPPAAAMDFSFLIREPADIYHAKRGRYLTAHKLGEFRGCPALFRKKEQGLVAERDSAAFLLGRAAHVLILEGRDRFEAEYAIGGPINPRTGQPYGSNTKAFAEWATSAGKPVLSDDQAVLVEQMTMAVHGHELAAALLAEGVAEGVVRCQFNEHDCQARLDWVNPGALVDFKTADVLDSFERDVRRYGYVHQLAFYRALIAQECGQVLPVSIIAAEKREPFRCGVWAIDDTVLDQAHQENENAMKELARCRRLDVWPTRYESLRRIEQR